jgi:hypothetical protein
MTEENQWMLEEIREAYAQILAAFNELFPVHPQRRIEEDVSGGFSFDRGNDSFIDAFRRKTKEVLPKLKEAADQSGNAVSWYRGQSLEGLNQSLKDRVEKALKVGI